MRSWQQKSSCLLFSKKWLIQGIKTTINWSKVISWLPTARQWVPFGAWLASHWSSLWSQSRPNGRPIRVRRTKSRFSSKSFVIRAYTVASTQAHCPTPLWKCSKTCIATRWWSGCPTFTRLTWSLPTNEYKKVWLVCQLHLLKVLFCAHLSALRLTWWLLIRASSRASQSFIGSRLSLKRVRREEATYSGNFSEAISLCSQGSVSHGYASWQLTAKWRRWCDHTSAWITQSESLGPTSSLAPSS